MNAQQLEWGNKIKAELNSLEAVDSYFERHKGTAGAEVLSDFFNNCKNLGTDSIKKELAEVALQAVIANVKATIDDLNKQFEEL